ncbi:MAG: ATP-dependent helicase HepA [Bermanella sp.]|jgi:ATP-dependent helicase HepA
MPAQFITGQRWISITEPDLGLGLVLEAEHRRVTIAFPAVEEERAYAADNAPLSRVQFEVGDDICLSTGEALRVKSVEQHNGCLVYLSEDADNQVHPIPEQLLSAQIQLHSARDRMIAGQLDDPRRFELRAATLDHHNRARASKSRGFLGPRVELIPHQFYIASSAVEREWPRLLLADEVGLGKTIEAGLIMHQLYLEERIERILILVPESLIHQWLVEMRRRFNLYFSIFDESRCTESALPFDEEDDDDEDDAEPLRVAENPFESEQLVIAGIDWLASSPERSEQLLAAGWDMLVVDEAHHLHWQESDEHSESYQLVETLCAAIPSALLLTATPENAGLEGHFARLRLLDPHRYSSLSAFRDEQSSYNDISELIEVLLSDDSDALGRPDTQEALGTLLDTELMAKLQHAPAENRDAAIDVLLDRFGTGRSLFRNSRSAVGGFPARKLIRHPLAMPAQLHELARGATLEQLLHAESLLGEDWTAIDPRLKWLESFLLQDADARVLLICASASTAQNLELYMRLRRGFATAVFHEGMTLLERDRAAAYFADNEDGAQMLVCSEIGSEGRNFQFAEHLVLFDLPLNPDLLEQRIGRLDRIGRDGEVNIHVPYFENSPQQGLLDWYDQALAIFKEPCTVGHAVMHRYGETLRAALLADSATLQALINAACTHADTLRTELHSGRNRLLELNSCRKGTSDDLLANVAVEQRSEELAEYLEQLAQQFGLEHEDHSDNTIILHPGNHMLTEAFPHLPEEGLTGTFDRQKALKREDMHFLTWEHPLVRDAMDMIVTGDLGSACVCTLPVKGLPAGSLLLESFLNPVIHAPAALQLDRYLPAFSERLLIDNQGRKLHSKVAHKQLNELCQTIKRKLIPVLLREVREPLAQLLNVTEKDAKALEQQWQEAALKSHQSARRSERERLLSLAERNPDINSDTLATFDRVSTQGKDALKKLQLNVGALRLAIVS